MAPQLAALLAAALAAAEPGAGRALWAQAFPRDAVLGQLPAEQLTDVLLETLPPPPATVERVTRYYGTVTVDHRAHLARRASCKSCHGPGKVSKLAFTPRVAHDRCVGCHREQAKGPTACQGCHVRKPPAPEVVAKAAPASPAEPRPPPGPDRANLAAAFAALGAPAAGAGGGLLGAEPFHRWLEVGFAAGHGKGFALRVASHENAVILAQSFDRLQSGDDARTLGLLGAGLTRPVHPRVSLEALALGGFDVVDRPLLALLPAVGARAGVEWRPRARFLQQVSASVTGVVDLSTRRAFGRDVGGATFYGTLATGFAFPPR